LTKAKQKPAKKGGLFIILGLLLICAALAVCAYNLYEAERALRVASADAAELLELVAERSTAAPDAADPTAEASAAAAEPDAEDADMPTLTVNGREYIGLLYFPDLELSLPVFAETTDAQLRDAPCRYHGTIAAGNLVICGHNYPTQFTKIRYLSEGSKVFFTDVLGVQYEYSLLCRETIGPYAIEEMCSGEGWDLTLFTCNDGGQTRCALRLELIRSYDPEEACITFAMG